MKTFDTQVRAQQHLLRVVPQGYFWWTSGVVLPERKDALAEKFADLYGIRLGKDRRYVRKSKGFANAEAVCVVDGSVYRWFLVVTDGSQEFNALGPLGPTDSIAERDIRRYAYPSSATRGAKLGVRRHGVCA